MRTLVWIALGVFLVVAWYLFICFVDYLIPKLPIKLLEFFHNIF